MPEPAQAAPNPAPLTFAAIGMGSNVGLREAHIEAGFAGLAAIERTSLIGRSSVIGTDPVGPEGQGPYLNAAALVATKLGARELLGALLAIEATRGRDRSAEQRWGPRTLDLDLLLFGDEVIELPGLTVPHPRMHERAFVLRPLAEIAGDMVVPSMGATVAGLLAAVEVEA